MNKKKIITIYFIILVFKLNIIFCEPLLISQKLYIFNIMLQDANPEFQKYLFDNFILVIQTINSLDSVDEIIAYLNELRRNI